MKTRVIPYWLPFCLLLFACGPTASRGPTDVITFDTAKRLDDFVFFASGDGRPHRWLVIDNDAGRGLAQIASDPNENRKCGAVARERGCRTRGSLLAGPRRNRSLRSHCIRLLHLCSPDRRTRGSPDFTSGNAVSPIIIGRICRCTIVCLRHLGAD